MTDANDARPGDYSEWKGWTADTFARLGKGDAKYFDRELREVLSNGEPGRVLEIGYGNGGFLAYCRHRGWDVTGTELLPELVDVARAEGFDARAADELPELPDAAFDLAVAFDVLEHIPPADTLAFLTAIASKLRPGGFLLLRYPNADSWIGNPMQNGDSTHVNAIGALKMQHYALSGGLEVVRMRAVSRRRFETSLVHGLHTYTAGVVTKLVAAGARVLYFPDLPVVLSTSNVITVLRKP